ncbi:hypothetical protein Pr1d_32620 [Bythopirellula goksoeyrii]|uniref:Uncharacterized protein n=1 Tax=Bythopirellula goksoeyrii TaxID=1400387 RepID=A0A5B9QA66_9BACT|nr:hypothetical protein Pr1d_32620 [Bythopirellula goksoeyrii]
MPRHLGSDLHQLFPQRRQRPVLKWFRQCQPPQKIRQVVRQGKQLQARLVVLERAAGELRPFDGVLAFLDPLLPRAATVVELHHILGLFAQVGHDEPNA